jgi:hypothetical protein
VKKEGRKGKVREYWHVAWMVEVETRIPGEIKRQPRKQRCGQPNRLEKPKNVWESLQDVSNLYDLKLLGGSYRLIGFLNI